MGTFRFRLQSVVRFAEAAESRALGVHVAAVATLRAWRREAIEAAGVRDLAVARDFDLAARRRLALGRRVDAAQLEAERTRRQLAERRRFCEALAGLRRRRLAAFLAASAGAAELECQEMNRAPRRFSASAIRA